MLKIALPNKGSLSEDSVKILNEAGYRQRSDGRDLICVDTENEIEFYYRDDVNTDARLAAKWIRNPSEPVNRLQIIEESSYQNIKRIFKRACSS